MSRYGEDYDYEAPQFPNEAAFFEANYERALRGKRGRQALRDLREALMALPEHKLIEGALCTVNLPGRLHEAPEDSWLDAALTDNAEDQGEGVCAVGALLWYRKVRAGMDPAEAFNSLPTMLDEDSDLEDTARLAAFEAGLAFPVAWRLAYRNDEMYEGLTPEERWGAFMVWIDAELAQDAAA